MNTMITKENIVYMAVAEACDDLTFEPISPSQQMIREISERGYIFDFLINYLREHPQSKVKDIAKNLNVYGSKYKRKYSVQKITAFLNKLLNTGYVKREEINQRAILIPIYSYRRGFREVIDQYAVKVSDAVYSLA